MDSKNALYFFGGTVLGVLGTVTFLWIWENRQADDIQEDDAAQPELVEKHHTLDKSSLDDASFEAPAPMNYNAVIDSYVHISEAPAADENNDPTRIDDTKFQELAIDGNYDTRELTLYSDDILADSTNDEVMSESDTFAALGPNFTSLKLKRIFEREGWAADAIYIRNDRLYTLYEITKDDRTYKEVTGGD